MYARLSMCTCMNRLFLNLHCFEVSHRTRSDLPNSYISSLFFVFLFFFGLRELNLKSFVDQGISSFIPSDQRVKNILYPKLNCIFVNHDEDNVLKFLACFEFSLISTCISFCLKILDNVRFYLILSIFTELINLFYGQNAQVTNI